MKSEKITFKNQNNQIITGKLDLAVDPDAPFALFAHCFTCSKDLLAERTISQSLAKLGINVMGFDFTGLGQSEGEFSETNFSSNISDLLQAVDYLRQNYHAPVLLMGHSLGGIAALIASEQVPECKAVITIGAPSTPQHVVKQFCKFENEIEEKGEATVELGQREFKIQKQFIDDVKSFDSKSVISKLKRAILIFHAPQDKTVSIDEAAKIYSHAKHPKSFISLHGADHLLTKKQDAEYVAQNIDAWVSRYVMPDVKPAPRPNKGEVIVESESGFAQKVITDRHEWYADEPISVGGNDFGPDPYEMLLASLGACTNMTLLMYANFKKIELNQVKVSLKHNKVHLEDCKDCKDPKAMLDFFYRDIEVKGPNLTDEIVQKLKTIANKCPVHRTLENDIEINTELKRVG